MTTRGPTRTHSPGARSSASPSTSAASPMSTSSARPPPCWPASDQHAATGKEAAMAEPAELTIGVRATCSDGFCGEVRRVIIKPATLAVTHLVVDPGDDPARLVPLHPAGTGAGAGTR